MAPAMKILFWLLFAGDTLLLLTLFILGLAAAPSSRTSSFAVAGYMLIVPAAVLGVAVLLFLRGTSPVARAAATLLVALPGLLVFGMRSLQSAKLGATTDSSGTLRYFAAGASRDMADAIDRNDTSAVARLAGQVDLNGRGFGDMTLLVYALRRLRQTPHALDPLRSLLKAGADPNRRADELPLEVAIQQSRYAGAEPVSMLLAAGANPNTTSQFGAPVFFSAVGSTVPVEILTALLDHGADLKVRDREGRTIVFQAANSDNWRAALLLLERGTDYLQGRTINGETFAQMVESHARVYGDTAGVAEVLAFLRKH